MTPEDTFDRRLGEALLAYAADAAVEQDPMAFAASVAQARPRRRSWWGSGSWLCLDARAFWPAVVLLLLLAAAVVAVIGTQKPAPLGVDPDRPIPDALYGRWRGDGDDRYLDLNAEWLVHEADGRPVPELGRALAFFPDGTAATAGTLAIGAPGSCGQARYRVVIGAPPSAGPTAAPLPTGLPTPSPGPRGVMSLFDAVQFLDPVDQCTARRSLLMNRTWQLVRVTLAPDATYDSLDFSQPFHMTMPSDAAAGLFSSEVGTMFQFEPHRLHFSHAWWNAELIDDVPVFRDVCNRDLGTLPDIPASVDGVGAWLQRAQGLQFAEPTELVIDGRRAVRWRATNDCRNGSGPAATDRAAGYEFYAIPTGDDVVLFVVRADTDNESKVAERIARAMQFD